jgi:DNA-binding Lrp family transcriptional regulator
MTAVKACVLIKVRPGRHQRIADNIARFPGIRDAFPVIGTADIVARIEVKNLKALTTLGTKIGNLQDVITTETLVAAEGKS